MRARLKARLRTWYTDHTTAQQRAAIQLAVTMLGLGRFEWIVLGVIGAVWLVAIVAFAVF